MLQRLRQLLTSEAGSAVPLLAATALTLAVANSPLSDARFHPTSFAASFGTVGLSKPVLLWINDGVMVVFFLLVGLEIKREVIEGELSRTSRVALPIAGALGGILMPAAIYAAFTWRDPMALTGWAIPTATDIAFAVAVIAATLGIVLGLFLGKQLGIFAASALLFRSGLARLPTGAIWGQLHVVSMCGGIGFTMSLFIGTLAFPTEQHVPLVRLGVMAGSIAAAVLGFFLLRLTSPPRSP